MIRSGHQNPIFLDLLREVEEFRERVRPDLGDLEPDDEDRLCRYCYNMALLEMFARAPIYELPEDLQGEFDDVECLVRKPPAPMIDDIKAQNARYRTAMSDFLNKPATLNPTFQGSLDVDGADADLLVDGCLIELKSSRKRLDSNDIRQVLGYCLLDYDDERGITSFTIYRTRYGVSHYWKQSKKGCFGP